jgi:hypothetical protein
LTEKSPARLKTVSSCWSASPRRYKVEAAYLVDKITNLRIFDDAEGKMNLSAKMNAR